MNELDDEVAKLFAEDEPITGESAFSAAVRRHVARRRLRLRATKIGLIAVLLAAAIAFAPGALTYAPLAVERLLASPLVAVLACAVMVWWNRSEQA